MSNAHTSDLSFERLDELIRQHGMNPRSLDPQARAATPFVDLGALVIRLRDEPQFVRAFRDTLSDILASILVNFPETIFWDFNFFVVSMLKQALVAERDSDYFLREFKQKVILSLKLTARNSRAKL